MKESISLLNLIKITIPLSTFEISTIITPQYCNFNTLKTEGKSKERNIIKIHIKTEIKL